MVKSRITYNMAPLGGVVVYSAIKKNRIREFPIIFRRKKIY